MSNLDPTLIFFLEKVWLLFAPAVWLGWREMARRKEQILNLEGRMRTAERDINRQREEHNAALADFRTDVGHIRKSLEDIRKEMAESSAALSREIVSALTKVSGK